MERFLDPCGIAVSGGAQSVEGGCLCGAVRYRVYGALRDVVLCHCGMCRRSHGHVAAYTAAPRDRFKILETRHLKWYRSSPIARRGFCGTCGSSLFWDGDGRGYVAIAAGSLDGPTGLRIAQQIHCEDAGDYYPLDPAIPQQSGAGGSAPARKPGS